MLHYAVCKSAPLGVSSVQRVKDTIALFISEITLLKTYVMDFESTLTLLYYGGVAVQNILLCMLG